MSLKLLQPGTQPLGQFDCVDAEVTAFVGGEVCSFASTVTESQPGVTVSGYDQAAYDVFDGYVNSFPNAGSSPALLRRPAVSKNWNAAAAGNYIYPTTTGGGSTDGYVASQFFLADDGILGYGTLFGAVVGGTVGQQVNGPNSYTGVVLGPTSALGSGKMTLWDKPGLYAVSLNAVDTSATGLVPTNTNLYVGIPLSFTAGAYTSNTTGISGGGLLSPFGSTNALTIKVGSLVEFNTNGSLVTTPNYLVAALNSPSGNVSSVQARAFTFATVYFQPYGQV